MTPTQSLSQGQGQGGGRGRPRPRLEDTPSPHAATLAGPWTLLRACEDRCRLDHALGCRGTRFAVPLIRKRCGPRCPRTHSDPRAGRPDSSLTFIPSSGTPSICSGAGGSPQAPQSVPTGSGGACTTPAARGPGGFLPSSCCPSNRQPDSPERGGKAVTVPPDGTAAQSPPMRRLTAPAENTKAALMLRSTVCPFAGLMCHLG